MTEGTLLFRTNQTRYKVIETGIMDSRRGTIALESHEHDVLFVTCFPFDAIQAGGPLRYLVRAEAQH